MSGHPTVSMTPQGSSKEDEEDEISPELKAMKIRDGEATTTTSSSSSKLPMPKQQKSAHHTTPKRKAGGQKQPATQMDLKAFFKPVEAAAPGSSSSSSSTHTPASALATAKATGTIEAGRRRRGEPLATTSSASSSPAPTREDDRNQSVRLSNCQIKAMFGQISSRGGKPEQVRCTFPGCNTDPIKVQRGKDFSHFYTHYREQHGTEADAPFRCIYCTEMKFDKPGRYKDHMKTHEKERPHVCSEPGCGKRYKTKSNLNHHHIYKHSSDDQLPFVCVVCDGRFYSDLLLQAHAVSHSEDKKFQCLVCLKNLKYQSTLVRHIEEVHVKDKVKCPLCHADMRERHLTTHLFGHELNNNYYCHLCDEEIETREAFIAHALTSAHQQKMKKLKNDDPSIPRCVPITSAAEYHDTIFFEPSDPNDPHFVPCGKMNCRNCSSVLDCKAVYYRDRKWIVEGKIACDQIMGLYLWQITEMTDDEYIQHQQQQQQQHQQQQQQEKEEEEVVVPPQNDDDDDEEEEKDDDDDRLLRSLPKLDPVLFFHYGGQFQRGFDRRTSGHYHGKDGKKVRKFFLNPRMKKRVCPMFGLPNDRKDPNIINLGEKNLIQDFDLKNRLLGGLNSRWGTIAIMQYLHSVRGDL